MTSYVLVLGERGRGGRGREKGEIYIIEGDGGDKEGFKLYKNEKH